MLTEDFARRTKERIAEIHATLTRFRELSRRAVKQLTKLNKQQIADRDRIYAKLGALADDVVNKLPEEATALDSDRAYELQEQINDLAADVEEISLAERSTEDLADLISSGLDDAHASLRETAAQLSKIERLAAKIGI